MAVFHAGPGFGPLCGAKQHFTPASPACAFHRAAPSGIWWKPCIKKRLRLMASSCAYICPAKRPIVPILAGAGAKETKETGELTGDRLAEFQLKWEAVIEESSLRWGRQIAGLVGRFLLFRRPNVPLCGPARFSQLCGGAAGGQPRCSAGFLTNGKSPPRIHDGGRRLYGRRIGPPRFRWRLTASRFACTRATAPCSLAKFPSGLSISPAVFPRAGLGASGQNQGTAPSQTPAWCAVTINISPAWAAP